MAKEAEIIKLPEARLSFPALWSAESFRGDDSAKRYRASFLLDPSNKAHDNAIKQIKASANALIKAEWGKKVPKLAVCFGLADEDGYEYDGYEGMFYIKTSSTTRPGVVDRDKSYITEEDGTVYAGCYVNATVELWTRKRQDNRGISAQLRAIQFVKAGEAFGAGRVDAEEEFDAMETVEDESGTGDDEGATEENNLW